MPDPKTNTKERLLKAASEIFAEKGFRDATVAEICEAAEANIAAVNYHFGNKETLYDEVWLRAFTLAVEYYKVIDAIKVNIQLTELACIHSPRKGSPVKF